MIEWIFELLFEIIIVYILSFPGAAIRYVLAGGKKSFKDIKSDVFWNAGVTAILITVVVMIIVYYSFY